MVEFRTAQGISDLIYHVKPLLARHLGDVAQHGRMTPRDVGAAFAALRDDGFQMRREETSALFIALESMAEKQLAGAELAVIVLLIDALQSREALALPRVWHDAVLSLPNLPDTQRAALANGLVLALDMGLMFLNTRPTPDQCITRDAGQIAEELLRIARALRRDQLYAIAGADNGSDLQQHFAALMDVIGTRDGIFPDGERWYPSEVVELTSHDPNAPGHQGCTALLLLNAMKNGDRMGWFEYRWQNQWATYCAFPPSTRGPILAGVRYLYESNRNFLWSYATDISARLGDGGLIPAIETL